MSKGIERWVSVVGFEGSYEVSDKGRVRSIPRFVPDGVGGLRRIRGKVLTASVGHCGYRRVNLSVRGVSNYFRVHVLIAEAFLGERPEGMDVCHNDGCATNNKLSNLRYDTRAANQADRVRHGTSKSMHLTAEKVAAIRAYKGLRPQSQLAKKFGVSQSLISLVQSNKLWRNVR